MIFDYNDNWNEEQLADLIKIKKEKVHQIKLRVVLVGKYRSNLILEKRDLLTETLEKAVLQQVLSQTQSFNPL